MLSKKNSQAGIALSGGPMPLAGNVHEDIRILDDGSSATINGSRIRFDDPASDENAVGPCEDVAEIDCNE